MTVTVSAGQWHLHCYCPIQSLRCNDEVSRDSAAATAADAAGASLDGCHSSCNVVFPPFRARHGHGADAIQRDEVENRPGK